MIPQEDWGFQLNIVKVIPQDIRGSLLKVAPQYNGGCPLKVTPDCNGGSPIKYVKGDTTGQRRMPTKSKTTL